MMRRKIAVVTTSRADYGNLYWLLKEIANDKDLTLQIIVTGMHLSPDYGMTINEIQQDGFIVNKSVDMLLSSNTELGTIKSIGVGLIGIGDALNDLKPDILVLLGDRFELICAALAGLIQRIPIAHIHGGETTQGAIDESIRHSITKMASIHFTSTEIYRNRVIQMGEDPKRVFSFGAPGLDNIHRLKLISKKSLQKYLGLDLSKSVTLVTFHPVTLENDTAKEQFINVIEALKSQDIQAVFTGANADPQGRQINRMIMEICTLYPKKYKFHPNLGQIKYLSCLKNLDLMIGNSSSGIAEAPSFGLPVVNIGDRQLGRVRGNNVIDVGTNKNEILRGIREALSPRFVKSLKRCNNPYDQHRDGIISFKIKEQLKILKVDGNLLKKKFWDNQHNG